MSGDCGSHALYSQRGDPFGAIIYVQIVHCTVVSDELRQRLRAINIPESRRGVD